MHEVTRNEVLNAMSDRSESDWFEIADARQRAEDRLEQIWPNEE